MGASRCATVRGPAPPIGITPQSSGRSSAALESDQRLISGFADLARTVGLPLLARVTKDTGASSVARPPTVVESQKTVDEGPETVHVSPPSGAPTANCVEANCNVPAAQPPSVLSVTPLPPLTEELSPVALLLRPPLAEAKLLLVAFWNPPLTEESRPSAMFAPPPLTEALSPFARLLRPPLTDE